MKTKLFMVKVIMVLVACLVFSMSAESATGGDPKQVEVVNEAQNPVPVRMVSTKIPLMLYSGKVICKGSSDCQTKIYEVSPDSALHIESVSIRCELLKEPRLDLETEPCITLLYPDPDGPIIPYTLGIASYTYQSHSTRFAILSKPVHLNIPFPCPNFIVRVNAFPNSIDNFSIVLTGYLIPETIVK